MCAAFFLRLYQGQCNSQEENRKLDGVDYVGTISYWTFAKYIHFISYINILIML